MQKSYLNYLIPITRFVILLFLGLHGLCVQSQNPFDLKSRKKIDTIQQNEIYPPVEIPGELESDSTNPSSKNSHADTNENGVKSPYDDSALENNETKEPVLEDIPAVAADTLETPISTTPDSPLSSSTEETITQLTDRINIKDDIALSGASDNKINWWYYVFDSILLLVLLGAFLYDKNIFTPLRKAFVHENYLRFLYRDTYLRKPGLFYYLNILFILSLGFIIFRATQYFGWASTFNDYLIIQGVVLFLYILKHAALYSLARLVDKPFDVKFYQYWMILSAGIIGLWMIPIVLMVSVLPAQYLYIAMIIICIPVILILMYRQFKALLHAKFFLSKHFFQFILYFCAVEIVPAVLLADILIQN